MAYVRLIAPFRILGFRLINGSQENCDVREAISQGNVVIFQREFPMQFDLYQRVVEAAREERKPILLEIDDLLFFLPETHPDRQKHYYAFALLPMLQALLEADAVIVPTLKMREVLEPYNDRIFVIPNYLDDTLWSLKPPVAQDLSSSTLVIGFMGTDSHRPDLEFVAPVLLSVLNRYPQQIRLRFWGIQPPVQLRAHPQVEWIPCDYRSYEDFAVFFQTQSADIFIAPLIDNLFNRCKSPLKFFEYSALGVPGVFSRLEPYTSVVRHGQNGLLAYSLDEWEECLAQLIEDRELRFHLAANAQEIVKEKWLLSTNAFRWRETIQTILDYKKREGREVTESPLLNILRSINIQLFESVRELNAHIGQQAQTIQELNAHIGQKAQTIQELNAHIGQQAQTIQELNAHIGQQAQTIQELNQEILGYVLSRSWRFTRPFRMVSRKISRAT